MSSRTKCYDCGANRALAEYDDGTYCHACNEKCFNKSLISTKKDHSILDLPENTDDTIPEEYLGWLKEFDISTDMFWSSRQRRLCFPYYAPGGDGDDWIMRGCWMRSLTESPKWLFAGKKDFSWMIFNTCMRNYPERSDICLVEDVVSGIKCSPYIDTVVLGGIKLSDYDLAALRIYNRVVLFLDGDAAGRSGARKIRNELKLTHNITIIRNRRDPKNHLNSELREILK